MNHRESTLSVMDLLFGGAPFLHPAPNPGSIVSYPETNEEPKEDLSDEAVMARIDATIQKSAARHLKEMRKGFLEVGLALQGGYTLTTDGNIYLTAPLTGAFTETVVIRRTDICAIRFLNYEDRSVGYYQLRVGNTHDGYPSYVCYSSKPMSKIRIFFWKIFFGKGLFALLEYKERK